MFDLGIVKPGSTIDIPFSSFAATTGASSATTGLATSDILVYKDGGTTERASAAGFTVAADFDTKTGINLITIDLADNTTAGFWAAGSRYTVVIGDITIDSQTVRFTAATFRIGLPAAVLNTTIATLASQTSFTLTAGPAEDNALNGAVVYIHDVASAVQGGFAVVSAYTGSTKTVTLTAGTTFTAAASDNVMILPPANAQWHGATAQTGRDIGASVLLSSGTGTGQVTLTSGRVNADMTHIATAAVSTSTAQLGVNIVNFGGAAGTFASGRPEVNASHWSGTAVATPDTAGYPKVTVKSGTGTGELSLSSGAVKIQTGMKKNQALANFPFLMTDSTNHNPLTGLTVTAQRSLDGAAFASGTIANMTEVSNGIYQCDLGAGDMNGDTVCLKFTASGADDLFVTLITEP